MKSLQFLFSATSRFNHLLVDLHKKIFSKRLWNEKMKKNLQLIADKMDLMNFGRQVRSLAILSFTFYTAVSSIKHFKNFNLKFKEYWEDT